MENFEQKSGLGIKFLPIKKYITKLNVISLITIILAGVVIYNFGYLKMKNDAYQKGLEAGRLEVRTAVLQELQQLWNAGQQISIQSGEKTILFQPIK